MTRVLVIAPSAVVRAGLAALVGASPALEVVAQSAGVATLAQSMEATRPDVVLLAMESHDDDVIAALLALTAGPSGIGVVVLADVPGAAWAAEMLRAGARALLPRDASGEAIVAAVAAAAAGLVVLHPDAAYSLLPLVPQAPARGFPSPADQALTPREIEVLGMLAEGLGNKTVARRLGISEHTVKFHVGSILTKLNASSRTEAVTLGARRGLIML